MFMAVIMITLIGMVLYGLVLLLEALARGQGREDRRMSEAFIHLRGVKKVYRTGKAEHLAISDATFDVMPGELVSLVGPIGVRQVDAAEDPRRPASARRGGGAHRQRGAPVQSGARRRHGVPGAAAAEVAAHSRERAAASGDSRVADG
jgi:hypothetical protein